MRCFPFSLALRIKSALAVVALMALPGAAGASPLGVWIDHTGRGAVEITDCGGKLCGRVVWLKDAKNASACGRQIIGNARQVAAGKWDKGWIYDPDRNEKYDVELTDMGERLRVLGYAGSKFLSETMMWKRAPAGLPSCKASASAENKHQ